MAYFPFTATLACFFLGKVVSYHLLGRLVRRLDVKLLLLFGGIGIAPLPLLWLVSTDPWFYGAVQVLSGVSWAAFELGTILSFLDVGDEVERTSLMSAYYALNSLAAAGASLIGGAVFAALGSGEAGYPRSSTARATRRSARCRRCCRWRSARGVAASSARSSPPSASAAATIATPEVRALGGSYRVAIGVNSACALDVATPAMPRESILTPRLPSFS
jgi:hypothetical protein